MDLYNSNITSICSIFTSEATLQEYSIGNILRRTVIGHLAKFLSMLWKRTKRDQRRVLLGQNVSTK